jgi:cytochrome c peroxidase
MEFQLDTCTVAAANAYMSIGTDPRSALTTRRGTGYYKVPSLKGVWYRGPFEHNGSIATLEDWFDPKKTITCRRDSKATASRRAR